MSRTVFAISHSLMQCVDIWPCPLRYHYCPNLYLCLCMWTCICACVCGLVFVFVYVDLYLYLCMWTPFAIWPCQLRYQYRPPLLLPPSPICGTFHLTLTMKTEESLVFPDETAEYQWQAMVTPFCFFLFSGTKAQAVWMVCVWI